MKLGFDFVPLPREIWDDGIELSQSEFRLLGWFCRDLRLGVSRSEFSDDEILRGVKKGNLVYPAVGLSRNSMQAARQQLIERKYLTAHQLVGGGGRGKAAVWTYQLNLSDSEGNPETSQTLTNNLSKVEGNEPEKQLNLSNFDNAIRKEEKSNAEKTLEKEGTLPSWLPVGNWLAYLKMRKQIKKPMSEHAEELALKRLDEFRQQGHDVAEILDYSVFNCYQGLFAPEKKNHVRQSNGKLSFEERAAEEQRIAREFATAHPARANGEGID